MIEEEYQVPLFPVGSMQPIQVGVGSVSFSGQDLGPNVSLVSRNEDIIVVRVGGYKTFYSRSHQTYIPTQYYRLQIGKQLNGYRKTTHSAVVIAAIVPGRSKKALQKWLA